MRKKVCPVCGAEFDPESRRQVYCKPGCAITYKKAKDNERSKARYARLKGSK